MTPTIEEVKRVALDKGAFVSIECVTYSLKDGEIVLTKAQLQAFAQHYIEVGMRMQRESNIRPVAADVLTAELDDKRDAERFRWLLENCIDFMRPVNGVLTNGRFKYKRGSCFSPREAIDTAIRNNTGE